MILGIIQARVSSNRLPAKVLKPILGQPMLIRQIERVRRACRLDDILVATSSHQSDDAIEKLCRESHIGCFRGSLDDVLDRFYQAARILDPEYVARITGDCPLIDPEIIDRVIDMCLEGEYDYVSNNRDPSFPDGLDVEVIRQPCLAAAWHEARLQSEREHVTPFIWKQPQRFRLGSFRGESDLSGLRWTVDEAADFDLVQQIYENLYPANPLFKTNDILGFLAAHPETGRLNANIGRDEGYQKSLQEDKECLKN